MSTSAILRKLTLQDDQELLHPTINCSGRERLSTWTQSPAKRVFDIVFVLAIMPILLPLLMVIACIIRLNSTGPALFLQKRVGKNGTLFTVFKFRTMAISNQLQSTITTSDDPRITNVGRLLRWWKLDELPQFINVLLGEMSLIGPRPKVPEQETKIFNCRPGITGAATLAFAQEELLLAGIPEESLDECFRNILLPLKDTLDSNYMARATLFSDLGILQRTAIRRWNHSEIFHLLPHALVNNREITSLESRFEVGD